LATRALCIYLILLFTAAACNVKKQPPSKDIEKTAFYTLKVSKDSVRQSTDFIVINIQVVDTKTNYKLDVDKAKNPNYLKIEITDQHKHIISVLTEHPLFKRFDIYSENGEIESKSISLQQEEVTFRAPYFVDYKKIKITEFVKSVELNTIIINNEK
jgi:hypothetical protein